MGWDGVGFSKLAARGWATGASHAAPRDGTGRGGTGRDGTGRDGTGRDGTGVGNEKDASGMRAGYE